MIRAENESLLDAGTTAASLLFAIGTMGSGSVVLGAIGAGFSFGVAAVDFELADDLDDVGRASLSDADALIDAAAAREHYAMALANLVLAGVDALLAGKALREGLRISKLVRSIKQAPSDHLPRTGMRNTIGRSGVPTADPHPSQPHLGAIHRGMEKMSPEVRRRLDDLLQGGDTGRVLRSELSKIEAEIQVLMARRTELTKRIDRREGNAIRTEISAIDLRSEKLFHAAIPLNKELVLAETAGHKQAATVMGYFLKSIRRPVDATRLAQLPKIDKSAVGALAAQLKARRADFASLNEAELLKATEVELRGWIADSLRLVDPGIELSGLRIFFDPSGRPRAHYRHGEGIHIGASFSRKTMFHEISHSIEHANELASRSTKAWRDERVRRMDPSMKMGTLSKIEGSSDSYAATEKAYAVHDFHDDYVAKIYDAKDPATEVLTMVAQELDNQASAVALYRVDPEMFFLGLGLLQR